MKVFRISQEKYSQKLSASGAAARWNQSQQFVLYTASSISLATLEMVVRRSAKMLNISYHIMEIKVPDGLSVITEIREAQLPIDWRVSPEKKSTRSLGSRWYIDQASLILQVPSAVVPQENNFVINTQHPDFSKVKIVKTEPLIWDRRLL